MKRNLPILILLAATVFFGCTRESSTVGNTPAPISNSNAGSGFNSRAAARTFYPNTSQPISLDLANKMIGSFNASQHYPEVDTAIRSVLMEADTLRAYLANPAIKTIEVKFAHQPDFAASNYGQDAKMSPKAMTLIVVGLDEQNHLVPNTSGGVYEHFHPCPVCPDIATYLY